MRRWSVLKSILIAALIFAAVAAAVLYYQRMSILRYTAETVIRKVLPDYVSVGRISFDLKGGRVSLDGFKIKNAPDFPSEFLLEIGEISCKYRMKGNNILDGIEIYEPIFKDLVLHIERLSDGRVNLKEMPKLAEKEAHPARPAGTPPTVREAREDAKAKGLAAGQAVAMGNRKLPDIVKLPGTYTVKNGRFIFSDRMVPRGLSEMSLDDISATLVLDLNDSYTQVRSVSTTGHGYIGGSKDEAVNWHVVFHPNALRLTMSNRFDVSGVQITPFEPYYDKYSPLVFSGGRFSGTLVFDFDNGNIGSTNEIHLSNIAFSVKPGAEDQEFWGYTVPSLVKYFTSSSGDIIFDFKIKGDMRKPQFYMGPITKRALTSMVVDKISDVIAAAGKAQSSGDQSPAQSKEEAQARAIGEAIRLLMKKK